MRVGVFGDSYAAKWPNETSDNLGWVSLLEQFGYSIDNYGVSASSLYYSWKKFKSCDLTQYDKIVFIETQWDRHFIPHISNKERLQHMPNIKQLDKMYNLCDSNEKEILAALKQYWILVNQDDQKKDLHQLMLKDLILSRPDMLIIPAFGPGQCFTKGRCLYNMSWVYRLFPNSDVVDDNDSSFNLSLVNHLTLNARIRLANSVNEWITTEIFSL